jgi:cytochrome P450
MAIPAAVIVAAGALWLCATAWYERLVRTTLAQVRDPDGRLVPCDRPQTLFGNLPAIYRAPNRLTAYNSLHRRLGKIVQLFWLWRPQVSVADYGMAMRVLLTNQMNYRKRRPNAVLRRLFGSSVVSENGDTWKRYRAVMSDNFSARHMSRYHGLFVKHTRNLISKWDQLVSRSDSSLLINVFPDLTAVFLDMIGVAAINRNFGAVDGTVDAFLEALAYIQEQSTRPEHAFASWWQHLPLPSNRRLNHSFATVDRFLNGLIRERRNSISISAPDPHSLLDSLLAATSPSDQATPLSDREVRDNLLAILTNGHQTVAVCVALSLHLLARHPNAMRSAQSEADGALVAHGRELSRERVPQLRFLDSVIHECLRLYPAAAGLQRESIQRDSLEGWSIPAGRAVGVSLMPMHEDPEYFGEAAGEFRPERYLLRDGAVCPVAKLPPGAKTRAGICLPLTFGAGARRCLGEHFAMYEMKVALALLLYHFDFEVPGGFEPDLELDRFGIFLTLRPANGVRLLISRRTRKGNCHAH